MIFQYPYTAEQLKLAADQIINDTLSRDVGMNRLERTMYLLDTIQVTAYGSGLRTVQQSIITALDLRQLLGI